MKTEKEIREKIAGYYKEMMSDEYREYKGGGKLGFLAAKTAVLTWVLIDEEAKTERKPDTFYGGW